MSKITKLLWLLENFYARQRIRALDNRDDFLKFTWHEKEVRETTSGLERANMWGWKEAEKTTGMLYICTR